MPQIDVAFAATGRLRETVVLECAEFLLDLLIQLLFVVSGNHFNGLFAVLIIIKLDFSIQVSLNDVTFAATHWFRVAVWSETDSNTSITTSGALNGDGKQASSVEMWRSVLVLSLLAVAVQSATRRDAGVAVGFRPNCHPKPMGGCKCDIVEGDLNTEIEFDNNEDCKKPIEMVTADNKKQLNKEIEQKFGAFKDNCFPKPSGGCKCNVDLGHGEEVVEYSSDAQCKKSLESQTAEHKAEVNEEIKEKFGDFKENCFPKPSGGCKCNEKDAQGNEVVTAYNNAEECKVSRDKRDVGVGTQRQPSSVYQTHSKARARDPPSQNVRDPVRERAQANYAAVLDELHNKFKGLKEGCFPRPKGCLCVIGKTAEGRDITERRMKDADCKCKEGERGHGCPAA